MNTNTLTKLLVLLLLMLPSHWMVMAQDEETVELPEALQTQLEKVTEVFPEVLELEWMENTDREVTMWLPTEFEHTPVEEMLEYAELGSSMLDEEFEPYLEMLVQNPDVVRFVAFYTDELSPEYGTNILVGREKNVLNMTGLEMLEAMVGFLPSSVDVLLEPTELELDNFESVATAHWSVETLVGDTASLMYVVIIDDYLYIINYTALAGNTDYHQAIIDLALQTLVIDTEYEDA